MASDLRVLASVIAIAGELERMGDYAKGIGADGFLCPKCGENIIIIIRRW